MSLLKIEEKLLKLSSHKKLLNLYRNSKSIPKGCRLKFNSSLCAKNRKLKTACQNILNNASMNIMKRVITAANEEIATLITEKKKLKSTLHRNNSQRTYSNIIPSIHRKLQIMETSIKNRHKPKLQRDNVNVVIVGKNQRKNRRFSRNQLERKKREKRKEISAVSKKELKRLKKTALTKTLSICQQEI